MDDTEIENVVNQDVPYTSAVINLASAMSLSPDATLSSLQIRNFYYTWDPKEDITPYELAKCVPIIVNGSLPSTSSYSVEAQVSRLGENERRHFKRHEG